MKNTNKIADQFKTQMGIEIASSEIIDGYAFLVDFRGSRWTAKINSKGIAKNSIRKDLN